MAIETLEFGRTGHLSSRVIFGAAALGRVRQEKADEVLPLLLEFGINHIDTAASYGDSELRVAPWLRTHRADFFLATKTGERSGAAARAELERSLQRLGTDHVDLIQLHNLVEEDEWHTAHGPGGAVEAMVKARDEGLTRFIGVTGHGLRIAGMHLRSLDRFEFDSVLFPYNALLLADPGYRHDVGALLTRCAESKVAAQTIKSVARRRWPEDHEGPRFSWYQPVPADDPAVERAVHFVLADPQVFVNTSSDLHLLRPALEAASRPASRPSDEDLAADASRLGMSALFDGAEMERI